MPKFFNQKQYSLSLKLRVFASYGNCCKCCGESNIKFLTIDHVNNDGNKDLGKAGNRRNGVSLYKHIIYNGYPNSYQVLCWNCNCGRAKNGGICPHRE